MEVSIYYYFAKRFGCRNRWLFAIYWWDSLAVGCTDLREKKGTYNLKKIFVFGFYSSWIKKALLLQPILEPGKSPALPLPVHRALGSPSWLSHSHPLQSGLLSLSVLITMTLLLICLSVCHTRAWHVAGPQRLAEVHWTVVNIKLAMLFSFFHILCNGIVSLLIYTCTCVFEKSKVLTIWSATAWLMLL